MHKRNNIGGILNEIWEEIEFFYAFPTLYSRHLPGDRTIIVPYTFIGMILGNIIQGSAIASAGMFFKQDLSDFLPYVTSLSIIPIATNLISGVYEWTNSRKDNTQIKIETLEKKIKDDNHI